MADAAEQQIENGADVSVHDSVRAAVASLQEADDDTEQQSAADQSAADQESDHTDTEDLASDAGDKDAEAHELEKQDQAGSDDGADSDEGAEEPEEVILAPASWSKDEREIFAKADRGLQEIVAKREAERDGYLRKVNGDMAPLRGVVEENETYFRNIGVTPDQSFRALIAAEQSLRFGTPQQRQEALQKIARDYGIPIQAPEQEMQEDYADPGLVRLENVFSERLGKIEGALSSRQRDEENAQLGEAEDTARRFFDTLDAAKPEEFPEARYVEQVMPRFNSLVAVERSSGAKLDVDRLVELYRDAAYATPSVREALEGDKAARAAAAQKAEEARTKRTIRKTSSSASGGSGVVAHSDDEPENLSVRDSVLRAKRMLEAQQ